jgi:hypothetical protein
MMQQLFGGRPRPRPHDPDRLLAVIRSVRRRWRLRLVLRGVAITGAVALIALLAASFGLEQLRFTPTAVAAFRTVGYAAVLAAAGWFLVRPLLRRVSDARVALYLEEHEPELNGQVSSAVEFGTSTPGAESRISPALVERLVERAIESCTAVNGGRRVEQPRLLRMSGALTGVMLASAAVLLLRPGFLSHGAPFLLRPWSADAASPFAIEVEPGSVDLPRGADLQVIARLRNFGADEVTLLMRRGSDGAWERWPMTTTEGSAGYEFLVFNVAEGAEYLVEAAGVRSETYRVTVRDLPYVDRIDLEYRFPAYTGLSPQREENGGDIAAVAGTRVVLSVVPTMEVAGGALLVDDRDTIPLTAAGSGVLTGELQLAEPGYYRVLLRSVGGVDVIASPDHFIDVLEDQPPTITFTTPGRDVSVTMVDEVFVEAHAEDDYGLRGAELVYAVNGGPEQRVSLYDGAGRLAQLTAGHTFYLEEQDLRPGDFLSYYARATDANAVAGTQTAATDIYFMDIRRFDRRYQQAESSGAAGAAGGTSVGELSARQRQIVSATFKIVRDSIGYPADDLRENLTTLALAQGRLREEVETLVRRMEERGVATMDSAMAGIAAALPLAVEAMGNAEQRLGERRPQEALSPEQVALQHLQRAEAAFRDRQISREQQGGQAGGSQSASAEELADLFELEMDKLRNQYERVDRGEQQQADQQVDEVLERLRELARRQEQENERMRARARQNEAGSGGGDAQRRLADEVEETARQLERLSREQSRPDLQDAARRLREAAETMRRAAAGASGEGSARGQAALDRLREARQQLQQSRSARLERDVQDALERAERLSQQQADVMRDVERLGSDPSVDQDRIRRLGERKQEMAAETQDLERQLTELSRDSRADQPDAAQKLQETARGMRDTRLTDKIAYSRGLLQGGSPEAQRNFEEQIGTDLENLEQGIRDALGAFGESREQRLGRALEETRDIVGSLESLDTRIRQDARGQQEGEQEGRAPQEGRQAQPGAPGQQPRGGGTGQMSPEDARQYRQELGRRRAELRELQRQLVEEGVDAGALNEILGDLQNLERPGALEDPAALARLQEAVIAGLKEFEFALRRQLGARSTGEGLTAGGEVPPQYRALVEEYYRSLSRGRR